MLHVPPDADFESSRSLTLELSEPNSITSLPVLDRQTTTDLTTNFLQESDKLVYGPLVLLALE